MTESQCWVVDASGAGPGGQVQLRFPLCVVARFRDLALADVEVLIGIGLDAERRIVCERRMTGTAVGVAAAPRDLLAPALAAGAVALIAVHNHPSGMATPSQADLAFTRRLGAAAQLCGVALLDHVIVASGGWCSLRESGWLRTAAAQARDVVDTWGWP